MNGKGLWRNNQRLKLSLIIISKSFCLNKYPLLGLGVLWNTFHSSSFNNGPIWAQLQPLYKSMRWCMSREDGPSNGLWFNHLSPLESPYTWGIVYRLLRLKLLLESWLFNVILLRNKHFVNLVNLPVNRTSSLCQRLVYRPQLIDIFVYFIRGPCYDVSGPLEIVFLERLAPLTVYDFTVYYH